MEIQGKKTSWWKDKKLLAGVILVLLSIIVGFYGKGLFIIKFYQPVYLITGLSLWALSWLILLFGIFLVGLETVRMIKQRIQHHVKKTVKDTYHYTKELPGKSYRYTKKLHKKGYDYTKKLHKRLTK